MGDIRDNTRHYTYDTAGNRVAMTRTVVTRYEYDALGRLTAVIETYSPPEIPDHETKVYTNYAYNALGQRLAITDALTHTTTNAYDLLGRLVWRSLGDDA